MSVVEMRAGALVLVGAFNLLAPFLGEARGETEDVQLRFEGVDLLTFVDWISREGDLNLLLPKETEALEGQKVTIRFAAKIPEDSVLDVAIAVLHIHGYDLVPLQDRAKTFKLVATTKLASEPVEFRGSIEEKLREGPDRYVAQLIRLEHVKTSEFLAALRQGRLLDETRASVFEFSDKNVLILLDYASSIRRVLEIAKTLDVPPPALELVAIPVEHRSPTDIVRKIREFEGNRGKEAEGNISTAGASIYADDDARRIVVEGSLDRVERVKNLAAIFDQEVVRSRRESFPYRVNHTDVKTIQPIVEELLRQVFPPEAEGAVARVTVVADERGGTLLFTGLPEDLRHLQGLLPAIDRRRPQVAIESAIVQLSSSETLDLGIELQTLDRVFHQDSIRGFGATQFGFSAVVDEAGQPLTGPGVPGGKLPTVGRGVTSFLTKDTATDIPGLLRALETKAKTDILSQPRLLLEDNAAGQIEVATEEPVTQAVALNASSTSVAFKEFVSAGTRLAVTPHIAPNGEVRLDLEQAIEDFEGRGVGGIPPAKTTRSLKTTIRLLSGQVVILGGFVGRREVEVRDQVPILGDIPLLGLLFRSSSQQTEVTHVYVLIRPVILDQEGAPSVSEHAEGERGAARGDLERMAPDWVEKSSSEGVDR